MKFNWQNIKWTWTFEIWKIIHPPLSTSGRGVRASACAGLINQLQRCRFDPRIASLENTDTAIVGDWWTLVGGTPRPELLTGAKNSNWGAWLAFSYLRLLEFHSDINKIHPLEEKLSIKHVDMFVQTWKCRMTQYFSHRFHCTYTYVGCWCSTK